jgi:hypothetical protein
MRLGDPQNWSGRYEEDKNLLLLSRIKPGHTAGSPLTYRLSCSGSLMMMMMMMMMIAAATKQLTQTVMLLTLIREVMDSNLGRDTVYHD